MRIGYFLITALAVAAGMQSWRPAYAEDAESALAVQKLCAEGISKFGKLTCGKGKDSEPAVEAYFYGASSVEEISKTYPERFEKLMASCRKKSSLRRLASDQIQVSTIESCNRKRGYQEPCVRNQDCLENYCHPVRGTCSAVFTVPVSFGN